MKELIPGGMPFILELILVVTWILWFFLWSRASEKARDFATDLNVLISRNGVDSRDLNRSLRHKEIRKEVEKNYDLPEEFVEKMKNS